MLATGVMLGVAVTAYMAIGAYAFLNRMMNQKRIDRLSAELLRTRLEAARIQRTANEQAGLHWNGVRKFVVDRKVPEADDTASFYLKPHDGKPLPLFNPGQFLTFRLHIPGEERPVVRCYSVSNGPNTETYRITVKHVESGKASSFLHREVAPGDILDAMAPRGDFCVQPAHSRPTVLLAGGVGITPLLSMLHSIVESGSGAETWLIYGVRTAADCLLRPEIESLIENSPNIHLRVGCSSPSAEAADGDFCGRITLDYLQHLLASNNYEFYICGPPPMMKSLVADLRDWGVPESCLHTEAFGPASVQVVSTAKSQTSSPPDAESDSGVSVSFAKSSASAAWSTAAENLLNLAESLNISIDAGCRAGSCGSCVTAIRSGNVRYLQSPGFECEDGTCLPCISVPDGQLELDA